MIVFFGAILLVLGKDYLVSVNGQELTVAASKFKMTTLKASDDFFFYILQTALTFTVYVQILQLGVRLFVAELSEAFQGISHNYYQVLCQRLTVLQFTDSVLQRCNSWFLIRGY